MGVDMTATPVGILLTVNGCVTLALNMVYQDCKKDRAALWAHISELEKRIFPNG